MSHRLDTGLWMTLRFARGSRYYRLHLEQDLWRAWTITHVHGRTGTALGRHRTIPARSIDRALFHLATASQRRLQRGYSLIVLRPHRRLLWNR